MAAVWVQLKTHCITSGFKGSKAREDCYYSVVFLQQLLLLSRGQSPASCSTSERGRRSLNAGWETGFPSHNHLLVLWGNISSPGQCKGQKFLTLKDCMVDFPGTGDLFQDFELSIQPWGSWMPEETGGEASVCAAALWSTNLEDLVSGWQRRPEMVGICGRDESSFCASVKTAQGVPGVPLAMLKTCRFSEGFAGTSPFLHHFFFSHHVGISWQAKTLSYKMPDQL